MAIVGDRPSHGVRFRLERALQPEPLVYEGQISTAERDFKVRAELLADGDVAVTTDAGADLAEKTRLLVRTVLRHAQTEGQAPPRLIQRWRADK